MCGDALEITQTFSYPTVTIPGPTLNFQPMSLPAGITYTLSDGNGPVSPNGVVNASSYTAYSEQTFTQTFYKDSKVVGSQTIKATVGPSSGNFTSLTDANDATIQAIPPVTLKYPAEEITVAFVSLGTFPSTTTIDFSPSTTLPTGVTYIITNNKTSKTWNNIGTVSVEDFVNVNGAVTFTQTFYLNGVEITGANSKRTVVVNSVYIIYAEFNDLASDTGSVTLKLR